MSRPRRLVARPSGNQAITRMLPASREIAPANATMNSSTPRTGRMAQPERRQRLQDEGPDRGDGQPDPDDQQQSAESVPGTMQEDDDAHGRERRGTEDEVELGDEPVHARVVGRDAGDGRDHGHGVDQRAGDEQGHLLRSHRGSLGGHRPPYVTGRHRESVPLRSMPPVTDAPILDIRLLGPPVVLVRGRPLEVDTRKAVAILALLATDGRAYAREELAALLWPDADDPGARGALRRTLSTLRAAVGDGALEVDRARVALVAATTRVRRPGARAAGGVRLAVRPARPSPISRADRSWPGSACATARSSTTGGRPGP